jgi:hypothetical protein
MDYKQFSGTLVIRSACGSPVKMDDPNYLKWLGAPNCPFPPDPPVGDALASLLATKEVEAKIDVTDEMAAEMVAVEAVEEVGP